MEVYAGYLKNVGLIASASGGAASYISSLFIENGIVYGVRYDDDFRGASYDFAENSSKLNEFQGSKYCRSKKSVIRDGIKRNVFEDVIVQLQRKKRILFIGLGCDIAALKMKIALSKCDSDTLYTIELLCDGVTPESVQTEFVAELENRFSSEIVEFTLRDKKNGWQLYNVRAKFKNGKEYFCPFETSDYGVAFKNYKQKACYTCAYKGANRHVGDLVIGDCWGCTEEMKIYNHAGVSIMIPLTIKGREMLASIDKSNFNMEKIDESIVVDNQPRYFTPHPKNQEWDIWDRNVKENGLQYALDEFGKRMFPQKFQNKVYRKFVVWGTGNTFIRYSDFIEEAASIDILVDGNKNKWGNEIANGHICKKPDEIEKIKDGFVMIAVQDEGQASEIANCLSRYKGIDYDFFDHWKWYRRRLKFEKEV